MSTPTFSDTHNMVAFLEKLAKSDRFHEIIDFLNSNQIHYALTVNPTIYTPCIEQFWATAKIKTVNGERHLQALVDKKKVIILEISIRSDLYLEYTSGIDCLPTATIFEELARMGAKTTTWNEFSNTMASAIICLAINQKINLSKYIFDAMVKHLEGGVKFLMYLLFVQVFINQQLGDISHHKTTYVIPSHIKKIFANMTREGKKFYGRLTPLFATMMVQATQEEGVDSDIPTNSQQTPIPTQPSTSKPQKKQYRRKQRKDIEVSQSSASTEPITKKETNKESIPKHSYDPFQSGEDRMQLHELMKICTKLSDRVLALETTKTTQALEIASLKSRVKKLEKKASKRTHKFKRLYRVGTTRRVESLNDKGLGAQEDASKQGMSIEDINNDAGVSLVDDTQGSTVAPTTIPVSTAAPSTITVSPPVITESTVTIAPSTILKAKGITFRDAGETTTRTPTSVSSSSIKDKGKAKMVECELPLNKKDQIRLDEELARSLDAEEQEVARLEKEQEQGELTIKEKSKLFMEIMNERKRHFAKLRAKEKRRKLKNKSYEEIQKAFDKTMSWINNFKPMDSEELKSSEKKAEGSRKKSIGKKRARNEQKQESSKRQRMKDDKETDEHEEAKEDDEAEMKKHMEIVQDKKEIAIDAIPLATKPPMIVE
ncbi:hypothetical protein Tco_1257959 [Tanacetum coccineum]